jgi:hypothetical protein
VVELHAGDLIFPQSKPETLEFDKHLHANLEDTIPHPRHNLPEERVYFESEDLTRTEETSRISLLNDHRRLSPKSTTPISPSTIGLTTTNRINSDIQYKRNRLLPSPSSYEIGSDVSDNAGKHCAAE